MKILVVHPAQQHSYRLATALNMRGMLYRYATTVYCKPGSVTSIVARLLKGKFRSKAFSRHCSGFSDDQVIQFCETQGLLKLLTMNLKPFRRYYRKLKYKTSDRFARKAAKYAIGNKVDAVVSYDDCSSVLFGILRREAPDILRIMDVSAANILYMRDIYERDMKLMPEFAERLRRERTVVWSQDNIERSKAEISETQVFLSPSSFVKRSLCFSGVREEQIKICPYGVDIDEFSLKTFPSIDELEHRPMRFIYVGGVKELKGISYLLEAFSRIPADRATLTVVGQFNRSDEDILPYLDRVNFTGSVLHKDVPRLLRECDVYVFPSLGEGLSLSTLEAAACGLPLIVSENSGINDKMTGDEGFVIPIQSSQAIVDRVMWFLDNPRCVEPMGLAARRLAEHYSWNNYYRSIGDIFEEIEAERWGE